MRDPRLYDDAVQLLQEATARRIFPAAVAEVGSSEGVHWRHAFGALTFDADAPLTAPDTVFDLASLTKPMATTAVVLRLAADGRLPLDTRIATLFHEWAGAGRESVTVQDLLEHAGGLSPRLIDQPPDDARAFEHEICTMPLEYAPRTRAVYTDLGFILLAMACTRVARTPFPQLVDALIADVAMAAHAVGDDAGLYSRVPPARLPFTAPTTPMLEDHRRGRRLVGEVHDNYAAALGGLAGHAGLFGTAPGVGVYAQRLLRAQRGDASLRPPFTPAWTALATQRSTVPESSRALGWDTMKPTSSCGTRLSTEAFGHVGFTGTSLWIDPERDRYYVLLTNRVCDGGTSEDMQVVRRAFHDSLAHL